MKNFLIVVFSVLDLAVVITAIVMREPGLIFVILMASGFLVALITDTVHLIPGDTETELYRLRMMYEQQIQERNKR